MNLERRVRLATGKNTIIESCECGYFHVTIGTTTLRLSEETYNDLINTIALSLAE